MFQKFLSVMKAVALLSCLTIALEAPIQAHCDHSHDVISVVLDTALDNPAYTLAGIAVLAVSYGIAKTIKNNRKSKKSGVVAPRVNQASLAS